jgi:hypothetical protein
MRRAGVVMAVAGLLLGSTSMAVAQDAASDDGTESQLLGVPDAGVEISLPAAWNTDIEMRQKEDWGLYDEGIADEPVPFWKVIYASDGSGTWCDLTWYPSYPLALDAHAARYEALMTPTHGDVERPIEVTTVELPAGEAYRFDIYNEPSAAYTTVYLLASGDAHYQLQCVGDEPAEDGWLPVAESLELSEGGAEEAEVE